MSMIVEDIGKISKFEGERGYLPMFRLEVKFCSQKSKIAENQISTFYALVQFCFDFFTLFEIFCLQLYVKTNSML